jgi:hypothetical protein
MRANTDWFLQAKWGVFFHYLAETQIPRETWDSADSVATWNRLVDGFDVEGLAEQVAEIGAGYMFVTLGQNSGYFLTPNATYDGLVGRTPSRLSERDLVADLAGALGRVSVPLLVYLPANAPFHDPQAVRNLRCTPPWDAAKLWYFPPESIFPEDAARTDERLTEFQQNWEAIIGEWSLRWGPRVRGWWVDGCYPADLMYRHPDAPNFSSFAAAMKAGNPDSLVAFNPGVKTPVISPTEFDDFTAGEISAALPVQSMNPWETPLNRWVDGAQYHILSFLGGTWGRGEPRLSDEVVGAYTRYVNGWEGVITWDIPPLPSGLIPAPFLRQLRGLWK